MEQKWGERKEFRILWVLWRSPLFVRIWDVDVESGLGQREEGDGGGEGQSHKTGWKIGKDERVTDVSKKRFRFSASDIPVPFTIENWVTCNLIVPAAIMVFCRSPPVHSRVIDKDSDPTHLFISLFPSKFSPFPACPARAGCYCSYTREIVFAPLQLVLNRFRS